MPVFLYNGVDAFCAQLFRLVNNVFIDKLRVIRHTPTSLRFAFLSRRYLVSKLNAILSHNHTDLNGDGRQGPSLIRVSSTSNL